MKPDPKCGGLIGIHFKETSSNSTSRKEDSRSSEREGILLFVSLTMGQRAEMVEKERA
jgi:hypothetical protein